jgi:hypothetical protein
MFSDAAGACGTPEYFVLSANFPANCVFTTKDTKSTEKNTSYFYNTLFGGVKLRIFVFSSFTENKLLFLLIDLETRYKKVLFITSIRFYKSVNYHNGIF